MASDLRTRAVLAPTMLILIAGVYWLDYSEVLGVRQGTACAVLLGLLGFGGAGGASSSFFFIEFIALTTRKIANAMIRKSMTV